MAEISIPSCIPYSYNALSPQVKYHEDFEKLKGKVTQVADDPETMRIRQTSKIISNVAYHGELERKNLMEQRRGLLPQDRNGHGDSQFIIAAVPHLSVTYAYVLLFIGI